MIRHAPILGAPIVRAYGTLTASAPIDPSTADEHFVTLGANVTLTLSVAKVPDRSKTRVDLLQDATGNRTVTWVGVTWMNGFAPTLQTAAGSFDVMEFTYFSELTKWVGRSLTGGAVDVGSLHVHGTVAVDGAVTLASTLAAGGSITTAGSVTVNGGAVSIAATAANAQLLMQRVGSDQWRVLADNANTLTIADVTAGVNAITIGGATGAVTLASTLAVGGAFGCNGNTPQTKAVSGGTVGGVIAALVACGILSS